MTTESYVCPECRRSAYDLDRRIVELERELAALKARHANLHFNYAEAQRRIKELETYIDE